MHRRASQKSRRDRPTTSRRIGEHEGAPCAWRAYSKSDYEGHRQWRLRPSGIKLKHCNLHARAFRTFILKAIALAAEHLTRIALQAKRPGVAVGGVIAVAAGGDEEEAEAWRAPMVRLARTSASTCANNIINK